MTESTNLLKNECLTGVESLNFSAVTPPKEFRSNIGQQNILHVLSEVSDQFFVVKF